MTLVMQTDCNLVLYETSPSGAKTAIWASNTDKDGGNGTLTPYGQGCYAVMQSDGNLVLYEPKVDDFVLWQSATVTEAATKSTTGHPFVGPFSLNLYNPYLILQRWGTVPSWKADPENIVPGAETAPTLLTATIGTEVIDGLNKALTNDVFNLQNALELFGWL